MSSRSIEDKLAEASSYKEKGNELFKEGHYRKAISKYSTVFAFTQGLPGSKRGVDGMASMATSKDQPIDERLDAQAVTLEQLCQQNISACYLKLNSPREAIVHADKALQLDPRAAKSHLRRGQAFILLKNYEKAREALKSAVSYTAEASVEATALTELLKLDEIDKLQAEKQKKQFKGIFEKASRAEEKEQKS